MLTAAVAGTSDRRTAMVGTLGPASQQRSCVEAMIAAGLDLVRLSLGNGSFEWHASTARLVREVAAEQGRQVRLLADLQGRKNRLGRFPGGRTRWRPGETVVLTAVPGRPGRHRTWTTFPWQPAGVRPGASVYIDDGAVVLAIQRAEPAELHCLVVEGGTVTNGRGVSLPGGPGGPPGLCAGDLEQLRFARSLGVELVALSFARSPADYREVRAVAAEPIIVAKLEHPAAVAALPEMAASFDGLMVARGDLGLEIPFEDVPSVQRQALAYCAERGKVSLVATQLLHSMRERTVPARAEVSDIAHSVWDGADALVLTGETSHGRHPVRAVEVLRRVIERAERTTPLPPPTPSALH